MPTGARNDTPNLNRVERLAAPETEPEESPWRQEMDERTFLALMHRVASLGHGAPHGFGQARSLWDDAGDARSVRTSLDTLRALAQAQLAAALVAHRRALIRWVLLRCEAGRDTAAWREVDTLAFAGTGRHGLAHDSLGAWLVHAPLVPDDTARLADWLDHTHACQVLARPGWQGLLRPCWHDGLVQWCLQSREDLLVQPDEHPQGLAELDTSVVCAAAVVHGGASSTDLQWRSNLDAQASRRVMACVMKMEFLGAMAMGQGVQDRGAARTDALQGSPDPCGDVAARHAWSALLDSLNRPLTDLTLPGLAEARKAFSDALVHASQRLIDGLGGVGQVHDAVLEPLLREQHLLRRMAGGVSALPGLIRGLSRHVA